MAFTLWLYFLFASNFKFFVIASGSMGQALPAGSVAISKPENQYFIGDIIAFRNKDYNVTHRIVSVLDTGAIFRTKGDSNPIPDSYLVSKDQIIGKVVVTIPYLGYAIFFLKTKQGLLVLGLAIVSYLIIFNSKKRFKTAKTGSRILLPERPAITKDIFIKKPN